MYKIRKPVDSDFARLKEIQATQSDFDFPDLNHLFKLRLVDHDDKTIAFGILRPILEAILVCDLTLPKRDIVIATSILQEQAERDARSTNVTQLHGFVQDPRFERMLKNSFDYRICKGTALVKDV